MLAALSVRTSYRCQESAVLVPGHIPHLPGGHAGGGGHTQVSTHHTKPNQKSNNYRL